MLLQTQEDELLRIAVHKYGDRAWALVSSQVPNRSSKSCSDRCVWEGEGDIGVLVPALTQSATLQSTHAAAPEHVLLSS